MGRGLKMPGTGYGAADAQPAGSSSMRFSTLAVSRFKDRRTLLWAPSLLPPGASPQAQSIVPVAKTNAPECAQ
jgi:hypothetical protein